LVVVVSVSSLLLQCVKKKKKKGNHSLNSPWKSASQSASDQKKAFVGRPCLGPSSFVHEVHEVHEPPRLDLDVDVDRQF